MIEQQKDLGPACKLFTVYIVELGSFEERQCDNIASKCSDVMTNVTTG